MAHWHSVRRGPPGAVLVGLKLAEGHHRGPKPEQEPRDHPKGTRAGLGAGWRTDPATTRTATQTDHHGAWSGGLRPSGHAWMFAKAPTMANFAKRPFLRSWFANFAKCTFCEQRQIRCRMFPAATTRASAVGHLPTTDHPTPTVLQGQSECPCGEGCVRLATNTVSGGPLRRDNRQDHQQARLWFCMCRRNSGEFLARRLACCILCGTTSAWMVSYCPQRVSEPSDSLP